MRHAADLREDTFAHGVMLFGWGTTTICIFWWRCRPGVFGLISWLCHGLHLAFFGLFLSTSKRASYGIVWLQGHLVGWDDGCWAATMMVTGIKEAPWLGPWTRYLSATVISWIKGINGLVILCYPTCGWSVRLLPWPWAMMQLCCQLNGIPSSFTPAWNHRVETSLLFEPSQEKDYSGLLYLLFGSDGC